MGDFGVKYLQVNRGILLNFDCISFKQKFSSAKKAKSMKAVHP